ncbi:MAG: PAS domain-containing protein [Actinomycetota bacterium]|nr:PAS domain-containing protein [Actinomycetota bacterium]
MSVTELASNELASTDIPELKARIVANELDGLTFRGELVDGHVVADGLLGQQAEIDDVPVGIYVLEVDGTLVACNETAIAAWGRTPELGSSEKYCGAHVLRYPSGEVMPHEHAPPSVVIKNGGTVRDADVICEQPNGNRLLALVNVFPIRNDSEEVVGAVNIFRHNTAKQVPGLS